MMYWLGFIGSSALSLSPLRDCVTYDSMLTRRMQKTLGTTDKTFSMLYKTLWRSVGDYSFHELIRLCYSKRSFRRYGEKRILILGKGRAYEVAGLKYYTSFDDSIILRY